MIRLMLSVPWLLWCPVVCLRGSRDPMTPMRHLLAFDTRTFRTMARGYQPILTHQPCLAEDKHAVLKAAQQDAQTDGHWWDAYSCCFVTSRDSLTVTLSRVLVNLLENDYVPSCAHDYISIKLWHHMRWEPRDFSLVSGICSLTRRITGTP